MKKSTINEDWEFLKYLIKIREAVRYYKNYKLKKDSKK